MDKAFDIINFSANILIETHEEFHQKIYQSIFPKGAPTPPKGLFSFFRPASPFNPKLIIEEIYIIFYRLLQLELERLTKSHSVSGKSAQKVDELSLKIMLTALASDKMQQKELLVKLDQRLESNYALFSYEIQYNPEEFDDRKQILLRLFGNVMESHHPSLGPKKELSDRMDDFCSKWSWGSTIKTMCDMLN